jgi:hypothetical protein
MEELLEKIRQLPPDVRRELIVALILEFRDDAAEGNRRIWWPGQPDERKRNETL